MGEKDVAIKTEESSEKTQGKGGFSSGESQNKKSEESTKDIVEEEGKNNEEEVETKESSFNRNNGEKEVTLVDEESKSTKEADKKKEISVKVKSGKRKGGKHLKMGKGKREEEGAHSVVGQIFRMEKRKKGRGIRRREGN